MTDSPPVVLVLGPRLSAVSGVTTHVQQLLHSQLKRGYSLVHFEVGSEGREESRLERLARLVAGPFKLGAEILRHDASIVHINCSLNAKAFWRDLPHVVVAKLCGASVVFQKHGGQLERFARNPLFAQFLRAALRLPDVVVVLSRAEEAQYGAFLPGKPVVAVPNGVDPTLYESYGQQSPGRDKALELLYIGRLIEQKGVREALQGLALARDAGVEARFVIAGAGPDERPLRDQVRKLGLQDRVTFAGAVAGEAKTRLISRCDVLLLPTRHAEGLPYSLLEAMAAGMVPIVTGVGAIAEIVTDGVHGLYVPPNDAAAIAAALLRLHENRALLRAMGKACRERVAAGYTLERLATTFERLYSAILPTPALRLNAWGVRHS